MRGLTRVIAALALIASVAASGSADDERPRLRHNPFDGPRLDAGYSGTGSGRDSFRPILKATSNAAGENSIVNLGGVILRIGEETHGYRLVGVSDGQAEFERAGAPITLEVAPGDRSRP